MEFVVWGVGLTVLGPQAAKARRPLSQVITAFSVLVLLCASMARSQTGDGSSGGAAPMMAGNVNMSKPTTPSPSYGSNSPNGHNGYGGNSSPPSYAPPPAGNAIPVSCAPGAAYNPSMARCVWVQLSYESRDRCVDARPCGDPSMPRSCSLYASDDATINPYPKYLCDRIFSPSMRYALVLGRDSSLAVYDYGAAAGNSSWEQRYAIAPGGRYNDQDSMHSKPKYVLTLDMQSSWYIYNSVETPLNSGYLGVTVYNYNVTFRLELGDDAIVRLIDGQGQLVWISFLPPPPQPPPPLPPLPPNPPPSPPSPPDVCQPGSAYNIRLNRCVWTELRLDDGVACPASPPAGCSDRTMPRSCGLYVTANTTGAPDSPYLCDRLYSPDMRFALVLSFDNLTVYEYDTETSSSWRVVVTMATKPPDTHGAPPGIAEPDTDQAQVYLALNNYKAWALRGWGEDVEAEDIGFLDTFSGYAYYPPYRMFFDTEDLRLYVKGNAWQGNGMDDWWEFDLVPSPNSPPDSPESPSSD